MYIENENKLKNSDIIQAIIETLQTAAHEFTIDAPNDIMVYQSETNRHKFPPKNDPWGVPGTRQLFKLTHNAADSSYTMTDLSAILKSPNSQSEFVETLKDTKRVFRIVFIDRAGLSSALNAAQMLDYLDKNAKANYLRQYAMATPISSQLKRFGFHYTAHCSQKDPQHYCAFQQNAYLNDITTLEYPTLDIQLHSDIDYINQMNADNLQSLKKLYIPDTNG